MLSIDKSLVFLFFLLFSPVAISMEASASYYHSAQSLWAQKQVVPAIENLISACSHRRNPFRSLQDLALLNQIQKSILDYPNPIQTFPLYLKVLFNQNVQILWACISFWFLVLGFFFSGLLKKRIGLIFLSLSPLLIGLGIACFYFSYSFNDSLFILQNETGLIPVRSSLEIASENPPPEQQDGLPEGLIVSTKKETKNAIWIEKPVPGWIEKDYLRKVLLKPTY